MERAFDLVVRGGTVVDGTGAQPFQADVGVKDGRIAAVGRMVSSGVEEIDARGQRHDTAETVGLFDRGVIQPGYRADLNVIDYGCLKLKAPEMAYDLPAGGRRLIQRAEGYTATILAGQVTYRDGTPTDALPGRLLRGAQAAPVRLAAE